MTCGRRLRQRTRRSGSSSIGLLCDLEDQVVYDTLRLAEVPFKVGCRASEVGPVFAAMIRKLMPFPHRPLYDFNDTVLHVLSGIGYVPSSHKESCLAVLCLENIEESIAVRRGIAWKIIYCQAKCIRPAHVHAAIGIGSVGANICQRVYTPTVTVRETCDSEKAYIREKGKQRVPQKHATHVPVKAGQ